MLSQRFGSDYSSINPWLKLVEQLSELVDDISTFASSIPGFNEFSEADKSTLISAGSLEVCDWMLLFFRGLLNGFVITCFFSVFILSFSFILSICSSLLLSPIDGNALSFYCLNA